MARRAWGISVSLDDEGDGGVTLAEDGFARKKLAHVVGSLCPVDTPPAPARARHRARARVPPWSIVRGRRRGSVSVALGVRRGKQVRRAANTSSTERNNGGLGGLGNALASQFITSLS